MNEIDIEIDGKPLKVRADQTLIQAADEAGIYIPRFCYHKHLSIPANCRMCLVEVEKMPKCVPACATPLMPGMKVFTKSAKTLAAQRAVMEFLLINHPLDCPVCDQGGECELQDLAMGYGADHSDYQEAKRAVQNEFLGPLIATEMTRCIVCTRCVRFGDEVSHLRELGVTERGEVSKIGMFVESGMKSELSGNIIDICPVGALTAKPSRFEARAWEMEQRETVSPHDALNSRLYAHTRNGRVIRVVAREDQSVNQTWISDRDRFSYTGLSHPNRLAHPMIKVNGEWQVTSWEKAFEVTSEVLQRVLNEKGADQVAALLSPNSTMEEGYLLQRLMRGVGSPHVDYRLRDVDTRDQSWTAPMSHPVSPDAIESAEVIVLIGSNIRHEQPLLAYRMRQAVKKGAKLLVINPMAYDHLVKATEELIVSPHQWVNALTALSSASQSVYAGFEAATKDKSRIVMLLGAMAQHHDEAALIRQLVLQWATRISASVQWMTEGGNASGLWLGGAVPHRKAGAQSVEKIGFSTHQLCHEPREAYVLLNVDPAHDVANPHRMMDALKKARAVIALTTHRTASIEASATVMLPVAAFTETAGTYVNAMQSWQTVKGVAEPFGEARPAWKVIRVLAHFLGVEKMTFDDAASVKRAILSEIADQTPHHDAKVALSAANHAHQDKLARIGEVPLYSGDLLLRHASPLQEAQSLVMGEVACVKCHPKTAERLSLQNEKMVLVTQSSTSIALPLVLNERVAEDAVWIPVAISETADLGHGMGWVSLSKSEKMS